MISLLKFCRDHCYLPLVKHRRIATKRVFVSCVVLVALSAAAFNFLHFTQTKFQKPLSFDIDDSTTNNVHHESKPTKSSVNTIDSKSLYGIPPVPKSSVSDFVAPLQRSVMTKFLQYEKKSEYIDTVVILTPIHNVARLLPRFGGLLKSLTYPHKLMSVAFGEDCSHDATLNTARQVADDLRKTFKNVDVLHFNITGAVDGEWSNIHKKERQRQRRGHMAAARNRLMKAALRNATWALWIDSDVSYLPPDIIQQLMSSGKDIVVPACLFRSNELLRMFDKNTWRETPESLAYQKMLSSQELMLEGYGISRRIFLTDLRAEGRVVPIDGVGGCTLLIKGDHHRKGLIFPETVVDHHIETEGLGKMAKKMGIGVFGMPFIEVMH